MVSKAKVEVAPGPGDRRSSMATVAIVIVSLVVHRLSFFGPETWMKLVPPPLLGEHVRRQFPPEHCQSAAAHAAHAITCVLLRTDCDGGRLPGAPC